MPQTYLYPTSAELSAIDPVMVGELTLNDPIFDQLPIGNARTFDVFWDQRDSYRGLMQWRGLDGTPRPAPRLGARRYQMSPGVFGEKIVINEVEMTKRASWGTWAEMMDVGAIVREAQDQLINRHVNRMRYLMWTLVTTGAYVLIDPDTGAINDYSAYTPQTVTASVPWATVATATPLANFRAVKLLARGQSAVFNSKAVAMMNTTTANNLYANQNANDMGGKKKEGGGNLSGMADYNKILLGEDLPQVMEFDEGYLDDSGTFQLWIPNNVVVVFGARQNNARLGGFDYTVNATNADRSSRPYVRVVPLGMGEDEAPPPRIEVHRGFNGGPKIFYPGSICIMSV